MQKLERPPGSYRILGLDPGSQKLGFAVIERRSRGVVLVHAETLEAKAKRGAGFHERMQILVEALIERLERYAPDVAAVEGGFLGKNPYSTESLAEMRGAAVALCLARRIAVSEYQPSQVKAAVTGSGRSDKAQVKKMLELELVVPTDLGFDATDAIAVALCHWHIAVRTSLHLQSSQRTETCSGT